MQFNIKNVIMLCVVCIYIVCCMYVCSVVCCTLAWKNGFAKCQSLNNKSINQSIIVYLEYLLLYKKFII